MSMCIGLWYVWPYSKSSGLDISREGKICTVKSVHATAHFLHGFIFIVRVFLGFKLISYRKINSGPYEKNGRWSLHKLCIQLYGSKDTVRMDMCVESIRSFFGEKKKD